MDESIPDTSYISGDVKSSVIETNANGASMTYLYDGGGRLIRVIDAEGDDSRYTYDNMGNIKTMEDGKGNLTEYEYDDAGR